MALARAGVTPRSSAVGRSGSGGLAMRGAAAAACGGGGGVGGAPSCQPLLPVPHLGARCLPPSHHTLNYPVMPPAEDARQVEN